LCVCVGQERQRVRSEAARRGEMRARQAEADQLMAMQAQTPTVPPIGPP
jgi:hypothetical protein